MVLFIALWNCVLWAYRSGQAGEPHAVTGKIELSGTLLSSGIELVTVSTSVDPDDDTM